MLRRCLPLLALPLCACPASQAAEPVRAPSGRSAVVTQPAMPAPAYLPEPARALLRSRMARHRDYAALLSSSALNLAYAEVEVAAGEIAGEPQLARPSPDERDTLNARLPARFFDLQDALVAQAKELRSAAEAKDGPRMARAYGQLSETCVACHAAYLRGP